MRVRIRRATKRDVPFITSSWLKSYRSSGYTSRGVSNTVYYFKHHQILDRVIPRSVVLVACNDEDADQILGWLCYEVVDTALVIHYTYVKDVFRGSRIADQLVQVALKAEKSPAIMCTHMTRMLNSILRGESSWDWVYNPYLLYTELPSEGDTRRVRNARSHSRDVHKSDGRPDQEVGGGQQDAADRLRSRGSDDHAPIGGNPSRATSQ